MEDFRLKVLNFKVGRYQQYIYIFTYLARYLQKWGIPVFPFGVQQMCSVKSLQKVIASSVTTSR